MNREMGDYPDLNFACVIAYMPTLQLSELASVYWI